jgi:hypothetical protein
MDKMLVAVFDSDTAAFDGLNALRDLHRDGDIALARGPLLFRA